MVVPRDALVEPDILSLSEDVWRIVFGIGRWRSAVNCLPSQFPRSSRMSDKGTVYGAIIRKILSEQQDLSVLASGAGIAG